MSLYTWVFGKETQEHTYSWRDAAENKAEVKESVANIQDDPSFRKAITEMIRSEVMAALNSAFDAGMTSESAHWMRVAERESPFYHMINGGSEEKTDLRGKLTSNVIQELEGENRRNLVSTIDKYIGTEKWIDALIKRIKDKQI